MWKEKFKGKVGKIPAKLSREPIVKGSEVKKQLEKLGEYGVYSPKKVLEILKLQKKIVKDLIKARKLVEKHEKFMSDLLDTLKGNALVPQETYEKLEEAWKQVHKVEWDLGYALHAFDWKY